MKPIIAIVGRPNVGKSTLFNRLARKRKAIVEDKPGVTRDRNYAEASWDEHSFILIDTGGFEPAAKERLQQQIREQAEVAIQEADLILFLMDGKEGLMPTDVEVADYLRKVAKPVFYVINKIDGEKQEGEVFDFYRLGVEKPYSISAEHGRDVGDLMDEVLKALPSDRSWEKSTEEEIRVALVGRPNVGKSSLLNKLIGRPRAIVDSSPGRPGTPSIPAFQGRQRVYLRRYGRNSAQKQSHRAPGKIFGDQSIEKPGTVRRGLDSSGWIRGTHRTGCPHRRIRRRKRPGDHPRGQQMGPGKKDSSTMEHYKERIRAEMKTLDYVPILFISALKGQRVSKIFAAIEEVVAEHRKRIPTAELNRWLKDAVQNHPPPLSRNRPVKLYYISQVAVSPPTFALFTNEPRAIDESYQRYLTRRLRENYGFTGAPLRLLFRQREKERS